jgi:hypothetical protein
MGATPKNFKTTGKDEGPSPLNSMECGFYRTPKSLWLIEVDPHRGGSISLRPYTTKSGGIWKKKGIFDMLAY